MSRDMHMRSLLVYADGRVEEVPYRLSGRLFVLTQIEGGGLSQVIRQRVFEGEHAYASQAEDAPFTLVYVERPGDFNAPRVGAHLERVEVAVDPRPALVTPFVEGRTPRQVHLECMASGGHKVVGFSDDCERCGLGGHAIRAFRYADSDAEKERTTAGGLRDELVKLRDENTRIKVENCELRRETERLARKSSPSKGPAGKDGNG